MDFRLTEEQELIRKNIREFAVKHIEPIAAEIDENSRHPSELFRKLGEGGWMGIPLPAEYGGAGADFVTHALVVEEVARACSSTGFTVSFHAGIIGTTLAAVGTPEQKMKFLVPLAKGEHMGAFCLTEPQAGTDVMAVTTTAVRDGDEYVIDGTKTFVSNGPLADTYILFCWTDRTAGRRGMSAFIVPKGSPGLLPGRHFDKMGMRSSQTSEVVFHKCRIPAENLLGREGAGFPMAMTGFDHGRIGIAAQAVGMLQAALDESIRYSKERVQFGNPIARHQAVAWMIADMATDLSAARLLAWNAASLKDRGLPFGREAAMAKLFATEKAMRHTVKAVQVHGGCGYIKGAKVERLMRDAKIAEIYEGTSEAQRMVISASMLR
ncbi:MAG: acyl-CoA dehydrogenase family protein [Pseudomonadota bacterium]|jgi:butyryl-CoA dehydrogenase|nr:acyl-CoA dehydrogenase family protein [Syntrophaceae bacterium]MBP7033271.1 acyl-CoA dehydrogenase family protein [Syntrophobacterales bacterium]MDI9554588.1 acyl-CoA dehydrogenase family protein [Pseudomonadota bacterium]NLX31580.1 acyl-CoA dehydrogenase [Deltaproteobacteria bacterium]HNU85989.1 acyl-CoA dehydrogenase family protein [Syntrophales bacterium]